MLELMLSINSGPTGIPVINKTFAQPGTFTWVCPAGVTSINCLMISPGQAANFRNAVKQQLGGSGGGLRYKNNIPVTPGVSYTVVVGESKQNSYDPTTDQPCSAFGISVQSGAQGTPLSSTIKGGYGGKGTRIAAGSFDQGGCNGGLSGTFTNGTQDPGYSSNTTLGGDGISINGTRVRATTKAGTSYGGGGGGQSGWGGEGIVIIRNSEPFG